MPDSDNHYLPPTVTDPASALSEEAIAWFARLRSERCSPDDRRAFESWRNQTPAHAAAYEEVSALWNDPALRLAATKAARASIGLERHAPVRRWSQSWLRYAAVAATIAGLVALVDLEIDIPLRLTSDYRTSTGEQQVVRLSDRSSVTLNTRSAIGSTFDDQTRRVNLLKGEAFFQVAPDKEKPFVVYNRQITTRAVGTEFLVREESDGIRVTVTEGVVELAPIQPVWPPIQLTAGQQVSVAPDGPGSVREVDLDQVTAWLRGRLVVEDARLGDVIEELRRYHSGTIQVWNSAVNEIRVSGSYNITDPAAALLALAETLPVRMAQFTGRIVILF